MKARYNIAIVGKTGVGKSALINYLFDKNVAETGVGEPVTERGFHPYDFNIKDLPVRVFDSWGLEAGKSDEWLEKLKEELKQHGTDKDAQEWFHTVYYCIGTGGARIENFEIKVIKKFISENYKVLLILTKADQLEPKKRDDFIEKIRQAIENIIIIPVCTQEKKLLGGRITKPFGREEIQSATYNNFWDSIYNRLPDRCVNVLIEKVKKWEEEQCEYINSSMGIYNAQKIHKDLVEKGQEFIQHFQKKLIVKTIKEELQNTLTIYGQFTTGLGYYQEMTLDSKIEFSPSDAFYCDNLLGEIVFFPIFLGILSLYISFSGIYKCYDIFFGQGDFNFFKSIGECFDDLSSSTINKSKCTKYLEDFSNELSNSIKKLRPEIAKLIEKDVIRKFVDYKRNITPENDIAAWSVEGGIA
ncbi:MAG: GTPase domain-containing protein [Candidatus Eremiobacterota bacterium]